MATIFPNPSSWDELRRPLQEGERALALFLGEILDESWSVFVQVWLNGGEVDVAAWSPNHGLLLYEVKDWHEGRRNAFHTRDRTLWDGGHPTRNPVFQVDAHRQTAQSPVSPIGRLGANRPPIVAGVYLHHWTTDSARELLGLYRPKIDGRTRSDVHPIVGEDALTVERVGEVLGACANRLPQATSTEVHNAMILLLGEAEADSEQRVPLQLSRTQRRLVTSRTTTGYRRIVGPAGSGKSAVLAARAAELAAQGRRPLVISFNQTLWHWIRDMAVRHRPDGRTAANIGRIRFCTFHDWCRQVCQEAGLGRQFAGLTTGDGYPLEEIQDLVERALADGTSSPSDDRRPTGYDDLLVDEAQDLDERSWSLLRKSLIDADPPGERLIAFDTEQNLYDRDLSWVTAERQVAAAGFSGPPLRLNFSYRLPSSLVPVLNDYRTRFLQGRGAQPLEAGTSEAPLQLAFGCRLWWLQVAEEEFQATVARVAMNAPETMSLNPADVAVLVPRHDIGLAVVSQLEQAGHKVKHVFGSNEPEKRRRKKAFWKGQAMLASTVHSFKGYEQRGIVLGIVPSTSGDESGAGLVETYIGLTRVKAMEDGSAALIVVSADERLRSFGAQWFENLPMPTD
jgi:hypothetical protein